MRRLIVLGVVLFGLGTGAGAEVVRCRDAAGRVTYNDSGCKPGDSRTEVDVEPAVRAGTSPAAASRERPPEPSFAAERAARPTRAPSAPSTGGVVILDRRGGVQAEPRRTDDDRQQPRRDEEAEAEAMRGDGYGWYPYDGRPRVRAPRPPRDLSPQMRQCDTTGCHDIQGNHYDRAGKVDRYTRPDGRTCRPVGTTVVC
jgi:hypothetical protein